MKLSCYNCSDIEEVLTKIEDDPPHLFLSGLYGTGKTMIATEFLEQYFTKRGIRWTDPQWCLQISSEQDRGIHRIRDTITEFVRRVSVKPGVYRWVFIDDADSLPVLSQQALRRPMETHRHTTRFLFCSRHVTDLIPPLKSRCLHLECTPLLSSIVWDSLKKELDLPDDKKNDVLIRCPTIDQVKIYGPIWRFLEERTASQTVTSYPNNDPFYTQVLTYIITNDISAITDAVLELFNRGHSFEDCLCILSDRMQQNIVFAPNEYEILQKFFIRGWISVTQGRTGFLDLLDLFITRRC